MPGGRICELEHAMKIALDATVIREPMTGVQLAVRHQTLAMLTALQAHPDIQAELYCSHEPTCNDAARLLNAGNVHQLRQLCRCVAARIAWQQLCLPRQLRRHAVDVVHSLAYTAPWRLPCASVVNIHDLIALDHPQLCSPLNVAHMRLLLRASMRQAAAAIVSSRHTAERVMAHAALPAAQIHVLPLGVDYDAFSQPRPEIIPEVLPLLPPRPYILFVGNLEPKKGIDILLDAYARVAAKLQWHLLLVGRFAWRSSDLARRLQAYQGPGRIHCLGYQPQAYLPELYRRAQVFVFPSRVEGFGLPILEAMAAGVPVIHSDHPVLNETAAGAGIAFARDNPSALAAALSRLHASPELQQQCVHNGQRHAACRSWQAWAESALAIVRSCV